MSHKIDLQNKVYDALLVSRSDSYPLLQQALDLVASFIKGKKRIIYGGMAIDLALKKAGHQGIYNEDVVPDYDFYSPTSVEDSNKLALILADEGLPNISSINAFHQITRKVRVNFENVADITYIPENLYNKIPTLTYNGFTIVHPHYQMIDMHRSISYLFENPPFEPVHHRIEKDMNRYNLLIEYYPIVAAIEPSIKTKSYSLPLLEDVVGGLFAYAYYYKIAPAEGAIPMTIKGKTITYPAKYDKILNPITITDNFNDYIKKVGGATSKVKKTKVKTAKPKTTKPKDDKKTKDEKKIIYHNKLLGIIPRSIIIKDKDKDITIFDNKGSVISAAEIDNVKVVNIQYTLMYCLFMFHQTEEMQYLEFYNSMRLMINHIDKKYKSISNKDPEQAKKLLDSPLFINKHTYGSYNWSEAYLSSIRNNYNNIYQIDVERTNPKNFYPFRDRSWDIYNYSLFKVGGSKTKPFSPVELYFD